MESTACPDDGEDLLLRNAERHLVADLKQIAFGSAPFTVRAARGEPEPQKFGHDAPRHHPAPRDGGQEEHDGRPQPRAEIGGTGGEVTELFVEREGNGFGDGVVQPRDALVGARQVESVHEVLFADVILLIEHDGNDLIRRNERRGNAAVAHEIARDEVALQQKGDPLRRGMLHLIQRELIDFGERGGNEPHDLLRLFLGMCILQKPPGGTDNPQNCAQAASAWRRRRFQSSL